MTWLTVIIACAAGMVVLGGNNEMERKEMKKKWNLLIYHLIVSN